MALTNILSLRYFWQLFISRFAAILRASAIFSSRTSVTRAAMARVVSR